MSKRAACVAVVALLTLSGCTSTNYAVVVANAALNDNRGCFRQCQVIHAGATKEYLACLRTCPGVGIYADKQCQDVNFDARWYQCGTEHAWKIDPIVGAIYTVLFVALATAYLDAR
jgi:hypothetical protein